MLSHLAQALPSILIKDRAPKTIHTYLRAFSAWKLWATGCSTTPLPVEPAVFCLYLTKLIQENKSVSAINTAEVADDPVVKQVVEAAKTILSKPPERKEALSKQSFFCFSITFSSHVGYFLHEPVEDFLGYVVDRAVNGRDFETVVNLPPKREAYRSTFFALSTLNSFFWSGKKDLLPFAR